VSILSPVFLGLLLPWLGVACGATGHAWKPGVGRLATPVRTAAEDRLKTAHRLLVQLQDVDPEAVRQADPDVVVVDYSWDGGAARELTTEDVEGLRRRPGSPRVVLAYLSIGEAESYRWYWKDGAAGGRARFLSKANPAWQGNYRVKYWDDAWVAILSEGRRSYLARIQDAGFDGVYLDTVDSAEWFEEEGMEDAADRMADLVVRLGDVARSGRPGFLIVAQNPFPILRRADAVATLSGAVGEAIAFKDEDAADTREWEGQLRQLRRLRTLGKTVMMVEYVRTAEGRSRFADLCAAEGFLCYAGTRTLGRIGWMVEPRGRPGGVSR
jgi:cysteinyl-tRNA synthetase